MAKPLTWPNRIAATKTIKPMKREAAKRVMQSLLNTGRVHKAFGIEGVSAIKRLLED